ncbi:MAG: hypothetical protein MJB14_07350 [Spirochaetes bacterium]|nr:hypothetical protein [Spirochaetota bacterium]
MKVFTILNPVTISNIYFITDDKQEYGVLIDPGDFTLNIYQMIKSIGAEIKKVIITNNGKNQTNGIPIIKKIYDAQIYAKTKINFDYPVQLLKKDDIIKERELTFRVLETPIHSFDSISLLIQDALFVGNLLQAGSLSSIDKSTTPSHFELNIVKKYFFNLSDSTIIYPTKGPATTLMIEKKFNPYFKMISH